MSEEIKGAMRSILGNIENRRQLDGYYRKIKLPETPPGSQKIEDAPKAGEWVLAAGTGSYKTGTRMLVTDSYSQNGFVYVRTKNHGTQRLQDIVKIK